MEEWRELHLAEGVSATGVLRLAVVESLVESGEQALEGTGLAFLDAVDHLIHPALDDLDRALDTEDKQGEPHEPKQHPDKSDQMFTSMDASMAGVRLRPSD
jgi:hypothetical protein